MDRLVKGLLRPSPPTSLPAPGTLPIGESDHLARDWSVRVHVDEPAACDRIRAAVREGLRLAGGISRGLVVVCIGTDRSTGDALGPLTGDRLRSAANPRAPVFGTLEEPVHAANLSEKMADIERLHPGRLVVAVDACLGSVENVGTICVGLGALRPGAGVNKTLPPVGDVHVTGVVNVGGFMEYFVLQNTRLHLVMKMAGVIAEALAALVDRPAVRCPAVELVGSPVP